MNPKYHLFFKISLGVIITVLVTFPIIGYVAGILLG